MHALHHVSAFLLQIASYTYPDTIITKQVAAEPGVFQKIASVSTTLMTAALLVLAIGLLPAAWNFRRSYRKVNALLDRLYGDITPLIRNATVVAEDTREIVTSLKGDARLVQQTVASANTRLLKAIRQTEARIDEFNALLGVIQEETESAFVSTAATVRGVRTGVSQIFTNDGDDDGDDDIGSKRTPYAGPARPRVRPKPYDDGFGE